VNLKQLVVFIYLMILTVAMCLKPDCIACVTNLAVSSPLLLAPYMILPISARCVVVDVRIECSVIIRSTDGFILFHPKMNASASALATRVAMWR
jgi:hypothetical protein